MEPKKKINRQFISRLLTIGIVIAVGVVLFTSLYYNNVLERQIHERDVLIHQLNQRDSILKVLIEYKEDSTGISYSVYEDQEGNLLNYHKLHSLYDSISQNTPIIIDELQNYNFAVSDNYNELLNTYNSLAVDYDELRQKYNSSLEKNSSLIANYNSLVNKYNEANTTNYKLRDSLWIYKTVTDRVVKDYGFVYESSIESNKLSIKYPVNKMDSAIMLFPHYKDKITNFKKDGNVIHSTIEVEKKKK